MTGEYRTSGKTSSVKMSLRGDQMALTELQGALPALGYRSVLEMVGERFHASPKLLQRLNPGATFAAAGEVVRVRGLGMPEVRGRGWGRLLLRFMMERAREAGYTRPGWYFWDETQAHCYGPYATRTRASEVAKEYARQV